jgi:hypothetical protein
LGKLTPLFHLETQWRSSSEKVSPERITMSKETPKKKHRRTAVEVANSQNFLTVRKMVQEGLIPGDRIAQLIQEFLPINQPKASQ